MPSTEDRLTDYGTLPAAIPRVLRQWLLNLNTAMPGEIISYDATTRTASVRGQISVELGDGRQVERPVISNAPVWFPMAGGFAMLFEPQVGDSVTLLFSMRGLSRWKQTHGMAPPDADGMLSYQDAIVFPGLGPAGSHTPDVRITSDMDGLTFQRADDERVRFNAAGGITIQTAGTITITGGSVTISGTTTVNDSSVASADVATGTGGTDSHTHGLTAA